MERKREMERRQRENRRRKRGGRRWDAERMSERETGPLPASFSRL